MNEEINKFRLNDVIGGQAALPSKRLTSLNKHKKETTSEFSMKEIS